jgi:hypothetical protein
MPSSCIPVTPRHILVGKYQSPRGTYASVSGVRNARPRNYEQLRTADSPPRASRSPACCAYAHSENPKPHNPVWNFLFQHWHRVKWWVGVLSLGIVCAGAWWSAAKWAASGWSTAGMVPDVASVTSSVHSPYEEFSRWLLYKMQRARC